MRSAIGARGIRIGDVAQDHRELIAAQARNGVAVLDRRAQPLRDDGQQLVARGVPDRVVDALEMIQIDVQQRAAAQTRRACWRAPARAGRGTAGGSASAVSGS